MPTGLEGKLSHLKHIFSLQLNDRTPSEALLERAAPERLPLVPHMRKPENTLYYGDNLKILRDPTHFPSESIDLIYLDPPFNSQANYNILFKEPSGKPSSAQIRAFDDTWHWTEETERIFQEIVDTAPTEVVEMMNAFLSFIGRNDVMAYLTNMAIRLLELKRVLKENGSIYLHCDPTASHYLKIVMDVIFGKWNFRNEIVWHYRKWPSGYKQFQRNHDIVLFYSKSQDEKRVFNRVDLMERTASTLKRFGTSRIISAYDEEGHRVPSEMADKESEGVPRDDVWDIGRVPPIKQLFPTQKPKPLLSRIIRASSKKDDVILDPFCGCGTTIVVAHELQRRWIGIDVTCLSIKVIQDRLKAEFPGLRYNIIGVPETIDEAKALAHQDRFQFQGWAVSRVDARPYKQKIKGADEGIDGVIYFEDVAGRLKEKKYQKALVSVKSGKVGPRDIRDLKGAMTREGSAIGIFLTLKPPTDAMKKEAMSAGRYRSAHLKKNYAKLQILTIEDLFKGKMPGLPPRHETPQRLEGRQQEETLPLLLSSED